MRFLFLLAGLLTWACSPASTVLGPTGSRDEPAPWEGTYVGEDTEGGVELTLYAYPACSLRLWNGSEQAYSTVCYYKWVSAQGMLLRVELRYMPDNFTDEHFLSLLWLDGHPWLGELELFPKSPL